MAKDLREDDGKGVVIISALAGLIGGLCCLTPVVRVLLGLASVSVAADLGNILYGECGALPAFAQRLTAARSYSRGAGRSSAMSAGLCDRDAGFHVIEVELLQVFVAQFLTGALHHQLAFLHDAHAVGNFLGAEDVVGGHEDGFALVL